MPIIVISTVCLRHVLVSVVLFEVHSSTGAGSPAAQRQQNFTHPAQSFLNSYRAILPSIVTQHGVGN
jgi:hypothetical protein